MSISLLVWIWVGLGVAILSRIEFWEQSLLNETLFWGALSGTWIAFRGLNCDDPIGRFRPILSEQLQLSAFIVFYSNLGSLPLVGELILIPSLALIGASIAIAESDAKFQVLRAPLQALASIVGLFLLVFVSVKVIRNPDHYFTVKTLKSLILPLLLIAWTVQFGYITSLMGAYEMLLIHSRNSHDQPRDLRFYTILKMIELGHLNARKLRRMDALMASRASWAKSHEELDEFFTALRESLLDPDNKESRDLIWPKTEHALGESRYDSMGEYRAVAIPVLDEAVCLWEVTVATFLETAGGEEAPCDLRAPAKLEEFLSREWPGADNIYQAINDLDRPPDAGNRFDRELESFCSDLHQIFWYYSPNNTSITDRADRCYLTFNAYRIARRQHERLLRAKRKLN